MNKELFTLPLSNAFYGPIERAKAFSPVAPRANIFLTECVFAANSLFSNANADIWQTPRRGVPLFPSPTTGNYHICGNCALSFCRLSAHHMPNKASERKPFSFLPFNSEKGESKKTAAARLIYSFFVHSSFIRTVTIMGRLSLHFYSWKYDAAFKRMNISFTPASFVTSHSAIAAASCSSTEMISTRKP